MKADGSAELQVREHFKTWAYEISLGTITAIRIIRPSEEPFTEDITHKITIEFEDGVLVEVNEDDDEKKALATAQKLASALKLPAPEAVRAADSAPLNHDQILERFFGHGPKKPSYCDL